MSDVCRRLKRHDEPEGGAAAHCYRFLIVEEVSPITVFKLLQFNMSGTVQGPGTFICFEMSSEWKV